MSASEEARNALDARVREVVAAAPPLTVEQRERLADIFRAGRS